MCPDCDFGEDYPELCYPGEHDYGEDGDCLLCGAQQTNDEFLNRVEEGQK